MATYLSIINQVLVKLREPQVASPSESTYSALIGGMVNETKREVEDAWRWTSLRQTIPVVTVNGTSQYSVTGAGKRFRLQSPKFSVYDATNKTHLTKTSSQVMKQNLIEDTLVGFPCAYYFEGFDINGDPKVNLYRIPNDAYTINFNIVVAQEDLSLGTEGLDVPDWPVMLGAYAKAIAERGEDDGRAHGEALTKYTLALSDAIAIDEALTDDEVTWNA